MTADRTEISLDEFREMVVSAYNLLEADKEYINSLNVFPVADGDTGTNMTLTMKAAVERAGSFDVDKVIAELRKGISFDGPGGTGLPIGLSRRRLKGRYRFVRFRRNLRPSFPR